jgi:hypothetical protein
MQVVTADEIREAARLLHIPSKNTEQNLQIVAPIVSQNLQIFQPLAELDLPKDIEPATYLAHLSKSRRLESHEDI